MGNARKREMELKVGDFIFLFYLQLFKQYAVKKKKKS